MSKESFVFTLGIIILFTPFLGIPSTYKEILFVACGALLVITGYLLRRHAFLRSIEHETGERIGDAFAESEGSRMDKNERPPI